MITPYLEIKLEQVNNLFWFYSTNKSNLHEINRFIMAKNHFFLGGGVHSDPLILYIKIITEWEVFFRSSSFGLCAPLAPPTRLEGRGRRYTLVEADARTARTATPIGCGRRVTIDVNSDWLEVTRCQRAPENKLERGAGIYLGQSHGFFRWAVISESWGYKLTRSVRLF